MWRGVRIQRKTKRNPAIDNWNSSAHGQETQEGERENRKEPKGTASGSKESKMVVYDEGETAEIEQPDPKRAKPETASAELPEM